MTGMDAKRGSGSPLSGMGRDGDVGSGRGGGCCECEIGKRAGKKDVVVGQSNGEE